MRIGIDIGGSHVGIGLVEDGKIIAKKEKDYTKEERMQIENVIENTILEYVNQILDEANLSLKDIELIGIAVPRNKQRWSNN